MAKARRPKPTGRGLSARERQAPGIRTLQQLAAFALEGHRVRAEEARLGFEDQRAGLDVDQEPARAPDRRGVDDPARLPATGTGDGRTDVVAGVAVERLVDFEHLLQVAGLEVVAPDPGIRRTREGRVARRCRVLVVAARILLDQEAAGRGLEVVGWWMTPALA